MTTIDELHNDILENNIDLTLVGEIELIDECIKWVYDGIGNFSTEMDEHLNDVLEADKEIIEDFLIDNKIIDYFYFGIPEINDTIISIYIYEQ